MGRYVFGIAAIALGLTSLVLHAQLGSSWTLPGASVFLYATSLASIAGGAAMLFRATAVPGARILLAVYLLFAATALPPIAVQPGFYASWGDVFYPLGLVAGAMFAIGWTRPGLVLFGLCNISYAIEQLEFFARSVRLVPAWMPLGGTFWAIATAIAFALAGAAMLTGYKTRLAASLLAAMLLIFAIAIYVPALIANPLMRGNWSEGIETFALAGSAWLLAEAPALLKVRHAAA